MPARVVVLGGGVGGTLVANLLDKSLGSDVRVTVVDPTGMHDYQPGYLYVALGEASGHWLSRDERTLLRRGVDLAIEEAVRIHPEAQTVQLRSGASIEWDYLVLATGARLMHEAIPGLCGGVVRLLLAARCGAAARGTAALHGRAAAGRHRRDPVQVPAGAGRVHDDGRGASAARRACATAARSPCCRR